MGANTSGSSNESQQTSSVWGEQSPYLQDLYQQGAAALGGFTPNQGIADQALGAWQGQLNPQQNPYLNDMTQTFRDQLGQANQASGGQAAALGGYGGGRQGVAEHLNAQSFQSNVGNFLGQQYQGDQNRASQALGMGGQVLGLQPYQQQQQALQNQAGLVGGPTVLGEGSSSGSSSSFGFGMKQ
jgi:hypothetical protein